MIEGLQGLVEVSRLDTELAARERERVAIPGKRAACAAERAQLEARRQAAQAAVEEAGLLQRQGESEARDKEALLAKLEGQQHQIKSNEAYTALLHEMEQARAAISEAETRILEAMDAIEKCRADAAGVEQELRSVGERLDQQERHLDERDRKLAQEIAELRGRREDATRHLDAQLLDRYERIAGRRSPAIAIVSREICLGCRVDIPPQRYIEILRGEELITCGHCQRILIHEDQLRQPAAH